VARELAAAMFGIEADDLGDEELVDALGEVTNMIGGNVKALVGGNVLSLPSVTRGRDFLVAVPGSRVCASTRVESCGQTSRVLLLARDTSA
jgi:chemotaxis protein CheX